jgi:hypothetical protein
METISREPFMPRPLWGLPLICERERTSSQKRETAYVPLRAIAAAVLHEKRVGNCLMIPADKASAIIKM